MTYDAEVKKMRLSSLILLSLAAAFVGFLICLGMITFLPSMSIMWPRIPFSSDAWKCLPHEHRYLMVRDLEHRHILDSATRQEVFHILGAPDYESSDNRYVTYVVKNRERGELTFDTISFLRVTFDISGRVTGYKIQGD